MVRAPSYDQNGTKKGAWSPEEDRLLRDYITKYGHWNWRELPKFAGLKRCGKSCRLRWVNYLRPDIKHGGYTKQEEDLIIQLHQQHGNKWAAIASKLSGRTDNEIKNHWHTHLKKRVTWQKSITVANSATKTQQKASKDKVETSHKNTNIGHDIHILESCPLSSPEIISFPTSTAPVTRSVEVENEIVTTPALSPSDIITTSRFDDDGGLEEIMNSSELFAELSSLSPYRHHLHPTSSCSTNSESIAATDVIGDIQFQDEDFWCHSFMDIDQVLLSPCVNYSDDNLLDFFCHQPLTMEDLPYTT